MRMNIILLTAALVVISGAAYADSLPTEKDYRDIDHLRSKLVRMKREMDRFVKDIVDTYPDHGMAVGAFGEDIIKVDMSETAKDIIVKADLPGMDKDKIEVTLLNNRLLKIGGSRDITTKQTEPGMVRQERMVGKFERVLDLPAECVGEGIKASYNNGVLELVIPKKEETKQAAVKIKVQ